MKTEDDSLERAYDRIVERDAILQNVNARHRPFLKCLRHTSKTTADIAKACGVYHDFAYQRLRAMERRGIVTSVVEFPKGQRGLRRQRRWSKAW